MVLRILDRNTWLNFVLVLCGFYFVFALGSLLMGKYSLQAASATHLEAGYLWIMVLAAALLVALALTLIFCGRRAPLAIALAVCLSGVLSMHRVLWTVLVNLDQNFRSEGMAAFYGLIPHAVILVAALASFYLAWLSNQLIGSED